MALWLAAVVARYTWVPHSRASKCIYFICVQKTGRQFPQPPQSQISGICNFWGLWLAALAKGVHWVWFTCLQMYLFHVRPGRSYKIPTAPEELNLGNLQLLGLWLARCVATQTCKALRSRKRGKSKHGGAKMSPDRSQKRIQTPHSQTKPKENFLKSACHSSSFTGVVAFNP